MELPIAAIIEAAWIVFALYWLWGWQRVKRPSRSESPLSRLLKYLLPLAVGIGLLGPEAWFGDSVLHARMYPAAAWIALLGAALAWTGVAFACWARHVLGRNWSAVVQVKHDHELVERGPYRWVRHPIYSGLLLAFLGTALAIGEWRGLLAVAIIAASFWFKLRLEERWMREQFGAAYADYMRRVKALVPGVL
ncbi:methyltransferase family protein [Fulvimonas soli]|jgi:protein-S-isoprenylcysteine O-methyltransferase Ste14|uniref:Phospholipid methyltransferase n=1 Tax=Fulvimonas soli TaxID=155197 RepID=A0A316IFB3_9GAMM|nr:isoprenylcysteine carboxylmethyltransferase family protein [Fulvimonas soli]PWK92317.1 phospholipid methyltransferase [Fulvimonas soli]TNY28019.1 isoprenylcysteine carboxyl methyltransferase [Fulvimonas soli]